MRASASGTLTFGLVCVPVKVYAATSPEAVSFNLITRNGNRVKQRLVDEVTGSEVQRQDCQKGYEYAKGQYVVFTQDELTSLESEKDSVMAISEFVDAGSVDPVSIEKTYYLGPAKGGDRGYALLAKTMRRLGKVAVAQWTNRGRDHLVIVTPFKDGLALLQCFYKHEVRDFDEVEAAVVSVTEPEEAVAEQLVNMLSKGAFDAGKYRDRYADRVRAAVEKKIAGQEVTAAVAKNDDTILDLYAALKASLQVRT